MYQQNPIIDQILNIHKAQAEGIVSSTSSNLLILPQLKQWGSEFIAFILPATTMIIMLTLGM